MKSVLSVACTILVGLIFDEISLVIPYEHRNSTCGIDGSKTSIVYEGVADRETYPWLGTLYYPTGKKRMTTSVVLVTKQMVIGSANEIDRLPKNDVRIRSRVVLGHKCGGPSIRVRDYTFHPDYRHDSYSPASLAIVQLEVDQIQQELRPICPPPTYFIEPEFYAMTMGDCKKGKVRIYKMKYVPKEHCKQFYRKSGLDVGKFWASHSACARAQSGGHCKWRSGTALVIKQDGRWRLLGFGLHGPGCQSPARFLDYGMQEQWVRRSIARVGMPAITRLADDHIIMRRSLANVQRFGPCDPEEMKYEIYTDQVRIEGIRFFSKAMYNLTLVSDVEYSCVILKAKPVVESSEELNSSNEPRNPNATGIKPKIFLRRWCAGPSQICHGFPLLEIEFNVVIEFDFETDFSIAAYGKEAKIIDPEIVLKSFNSLESGAKFFFHTYDGLLSYLRMAKSMLSLKWFF